MNFEIKKAGADNSDELREIGIRSYLPHYAHLWKPGGIEWYMSRCFGADSLQTELSNPNVEYYIVSSAGENIGVIKLVLQKALPDSDIENALYLEKIYLIKEWTGKGLGGKLIEFITKRARELKRDFVWLMAMDSAAKPIEAYKKAGFTNHSFTNLGDEFELMKEEFRGMVVMKYCLGKNGN